ncbi:hypothetical protein M758_9G133100 [Ceratodon purpureus]|nr:hypothetical protein M758_9G133100 [Ceratodon purpureus]
MMSNRVLGFNDVDSTGGDAEVTTIPKGSATVYVDNDGKKRCITCGAVLANEEQSVLDGTAEVGDDSAADALPAGIAPNGTAVAVDSAASALPGILNGATVKFLNCNGNIVPVVILSDGTAFVVDSDGILVPMTLSDGTAFVEVDSDAKGASTDAKGASTDGEGASYGAKAAKLCKIMAGGAVVGAVGCMVAPVGLAAGLGLAGFTGSGIAGGSWAASWMSSIALSNGGGVAAGSLYSVLQATAMGGGLMPAASTVGAVTGGGLGSWLSSKLPKNLFRKTTSSNGRGCDSGCDVDPKEKSKERRCITCGTPVAAATSLPARVDFTSAGDLHPSGVDCTSTGDLDPSAPETSPGDHPWMKRDGSEKTNDEERK